MNASISDSPRSSLQSFRRPNTARTSNNSRYRRPALKPLLKIISVFSGSGISSLPTRPDSEVWNRLVETRRLEDALVFLSPLTLERKCYSVSDLRSTDMPQCRRCGLTPHHFWAREQYPFIPTFYLTSTAASKNLDLHAKDFFNNTTLHYLAASEIDIDSKLTAFLQPTAPIRATNYSGQTFLHFLNPKSLGECLRRLPEVLHTFATFSFLFQMLDHNDETFLQTLLQHKDVDTVDYGTMRENFRDTAISVHSRNRNERCIHDILRELLPFAEAQRLRDEFTLDKKGLYHHFNNESVYDFKQLVTNPSDSMMWRIETSVPSDQILFCCDRDYENSRTVQLTVSSANPYGLLRDFLCRLGARGDINWIDAWGNTLLGSFAGVWLEDTHYSKDERDMIIRDLVRRGADMQHNELHRRNTSSHRNSDRTRYRG